MSEPFERLRVLREWVQKADGSLVLAAAGLRLRKNCPADQVCFQAQQCVEKYLKASFILRGVPFPRTHDITELMRVLPVGKRPPLGLVEQQNLTTYAVVTRYPGDYPPVTIADARAAVKQARLVRAWCRKLLPRGALRP